MEASQIIDLNFVFRPEANKENVIYHAAELTLTLTDFVFVFPY